MAPLLCHKARLLLHYVCTITMVLLPFKSTSIVVVALENGLGLTPPMGWNSWNKFACDVSEELMKTTADQIVKLGLRDVGYEYVNVDDCWQVSRDSSTGKILEDKERFPNGMKAVADYIHSLGLKFGIYSDGGEFTCMHRPGSLDYELIDARTYADWGVDYVKYDNCYDKGIPPKPRMEAFGEALKRVGRPMFYSICEWGIDDPATWAPRIGNSWRTTYDIKATYESITEIADANDKWADYAGPGAWNDPDMLEVGNGMTLQEDRAHFSIWALVKSPLLLGNDLETMSQDTLNILMNKEVIAINQDPLGIQGKRVKVVPVKTNQTRTNPTTGQTEQYLDFHNKNHTLQVWCGPLQNGDIAVVLWNRSPIPSTISLEWSDLSKCHAALQKNQNLYIRDLWRHEDLGTYPGTFSYEIESHDAGMYRIRTEETIQKEKQKQFFTIVSVCFLIWILVRIYRWSKKDKHLKD